MNAPAKARAAKKDIIEARISARNKYLYWPRHDYTWYEEAWLSTYDYLSHPTLPSTHTLTVMPAPTVWDRIRGWFK